MPWQHLLRDGCGQDARLLLTAHTMPHLMGCQCLASHTDMAALTLPAGGLGTARWSRCDPLPNLTALSEFIPMYPTNDECVVGNVGAGDHRSRLRDAPIHMRTAARVMHTNAEFDEKGWDMHSFSGRIRFCKSRSLEARRKPQKSTKS